MDVLKIRKVFLIYNQYMKHLSKFETFDFSQSLPITSVDVLTSYHSCDECDGIWKEFNEDVKNCKYCGSEEIEELEENEFNELVNTRLNNDESDELNKDRINDEDTFVDLLNLKSRKNYGN